MPYVDVTIIDFVTNIDYRIDFSRDSKERINVLFNNIFFVLSKCFKGPLPQKIEIFEGLNDRNIEILLVRVGRKVRSKKYLPTNFAISFPPNFSTFSHV